jgi:hypothetical protein
VGTGENSPLSRKRTFIVKNYHFSREFHNRNKNGQHAEDIEKNINANAKVPYRRSSKILLVRMSL